MKMFKRIKTRFTEYVYDTSIDLKDRSYVVFTILLLISFAANLIAGIIAGETLTLTLEGLAIGAVYGAYVFIEVKRGKTNRARILSSVFLVVVIMPVMFFSRGGIRAGTPVALLTYSFILVLVLEGRIRRVMLLLNILIMGACWTVSYIFPGLVSEYIRPTEYFYSYINFFLGGLVLTALFTFHTRLLKRESELANAKTKELEELNRAQNQFFSSMSHEIRTPINTVLGLNEIILRQEDASDEIRKDARNIQGAGKMLLALINDILDVSKIEAGKMDIVPVNYSVPSLLSEIVNMIWLKAEEKGLEFNVDIDPDVPETLFGDEVRIKQILINLLNNAVKYTKEGFVNLHMECEFPDKDNALLKISVADSGMGIKAEALPHLFDTFQRQDEEKNRYIEGTGLGLSIVKQLVELMGGTITVNSVYSQGTIFTVAVKQGIASEKRIGEIDIKNAGSGSGEKFEHSFHAPGAQILIVDDNEMNLQVEQKLLEGTEMIVDLSLSGEDALKKTLTTHYDLIFMDHLMPEMSGIECYQKIREQKGGLNQDVPIIVLTANAGGENIELYNETGFDGYLVKPVSGRQLEDMLVSYLPQDKVIYTQEAELTGSSIKTAAGYARKKPVVITCSSMADIPPSVIKELDIRTIPFTVITDEGVFWDNIDIDSDELFRYMGEEMRMVSSDAPTIDEYIKFYATQLKSAHHVISIELTSSSSKSFERASTAARTFENVTVINSECLSSSTGILVMIAAKLAKQNASVERIVSEIEIAKKNIQCSFVLRNTDQMTRRGQIKPAINNILTTLWLRPVLRMKDDKLGVGKFFFGSDKRCYEKYIKSALSHKHHPDTDFVFVTYAGMNENELMWIKELIEKRVPFENFVFQKASAGISSNCGPGTFGILYLEKGDRSYNLSAVLPKEAEDTDVEDEELLEEEILEENTSLEKKEEGESQTNEPSLSPAPEPEPEPAEKKWYEMIPELDAKAAIKNSGSEEAFLTVIKIFYDSYDAKSGEIQGFYDAGDWENYTIKVHALKSGSRLVGFLKLGDGAEALEKAGKSNDLDYIKAHHDEVMGEYREIRDALNDQFGVSDDREPIPEGTLEEAYGALSEFTQAQDYECVKMVLDSVKEFKLPAEDEERFKRMGTHLAQMDWAAITSVLGERS